MQRKRRYSTCTMLMRTLAQSALATHALQQSRLRRERPRRGARDRRVGSRHLRVSRRECISGAGIKTRSAAGAGASSRLGVFWVRTGSACSATPRRTWPWETLAFCSYCSTRASNSRPKRLRKLGEFLIRISAVHPDGGDVLLFSFYLGPLVPIVDKAASSIGIPIDDALLKTIEATPVAAFVSPRRGRCRRRLSAPPVLEARGWKDLPEGAAALSILLLQDLGRGADLGRFAISGRRRLGRRRRRHCSVSLQGDGGLLRGVISGVSRTEGGSTSSPRRGPPKLSWPRRFISSDRRVGLPGGHRIVGDNRSLSRRAFY